MDELPREPGTVWLRLLGRGSVQAGAIGEVGVKVGAARQAKLLAMGLAEFEALRAHLKQHRSWPSPRR